MNLPILNYLVDPTDDVFDKVLRPSNLCLKQVKFEENFEGKI